MSIPHAYVFLEDKRLKLLRLLSRTRLLKWPATYEYEGEGTPNSFDNSSLRFISKSLFGTKSLQKWKQIVGRLGITSLARTMLQFDMEPQTQVS